MIDGAFFDVVAHADGFDFGLAVGEVVAEGAEPGDIDVAALEAFNDGCVAGGFVDLDFFAGLGFEVGADGFEAFDHFEGVFAGDEGDGEGAWVGLFFGGGGGVSATAEGEEEQGQEGYLSGESGRHGWDCPAGC